MTLKKGFRQYRSRVFLLLFALLFTAAASYAINVDYNIRVSAAYENSSVFTDSKDITQQCDSACDYDLPSFEIPPGYISVNYLINNSQTEVFTVVFLSNRIDSTQNTGDRILVEIISPAQEEPEEEIPPEEQSDKEKNKEEEKPRVICEEDNCEKTCTVCSDGNCHEPGFECTEEIQVDKVSPHKLEIGTAQLNVLIRNTGTVDLVNIYAAISGDGITTIEKIPIETLQRGDKDYTFSKLNITKPGEIDLVIKVFIEDKLKKTEVRQITVTAPVEQKKPSSDEQELNTTELSEKLSETKDKYNSVLRKYEEKKEEYELSGMQENFKDIKSYLISAQSALVEEEFKKAVANLAISEENLAELEKNIDEAKKKKTSLSDKLRNKMIYVGSIAAAIVSIFTAYGIIRSNINRNKEGSSKKTSDNKSKSKDKKKEKKVKKVGKHKEEKKEDAVDGGLSEDSEENSHNEEVEEKKDE
jgi:hypothetical protein